MNTEREQQAPVPVEGSDVKQKPHHRLPALITAAYEETNPERKAELSGPIIDALIAMRAPGDEAEEARIVLAHLEAKTLSELVDVQGREVHAEAVATLLSLGFPYALNISPDDLERFRSSELGGSLGSLWIKNQGARNTAAVLAATGPITALGVQLAEHSSASSLMSYAAAAFGLTGALWLFRSKPMPDAQLGPLSLMTVSALSGLLAVVATADLTALWGPAFMIPALLVALIGQKQRE